MLPKHHIDEATGMQVCSHPSGHRSHASDVSAYGGSATIRSAVRASAGSTFRQSPRYSWTVPSSK
jgi:hypothetical protein